MLMMDAYHTNNRMKSKRKEILLKKSRTHTLRTFGNFKEFLDDYESKHLTISQEKLLPHIIQLATSKAKLPKYFTADKLHALNKAYKQELEELDSIYRNWVPKRRQILTILNESVKNLENLRRYSAEGRLWSSVVDILGRITSVALKPLSTKWSSGVLYTSSAFCFMTLVITLVEMSRSNVITEEVMDVMRDDRYISKRIRLWFRRLSEFDRQVQNFFPHGIDTGIVECLLGIRKCSCSLRTSLKLLLPKGESLKPQEMIRLIILLSNVAKDEDLMHDDDFLAKLDLFSKSSCAQNWFNKFKYQEKYSMSDDDSKILNVQDCLWQSSLNFQKWPSICAPICMLSSESIACNLILNAMTAVEAYSSLHSGLRTKEYKVLTEIRNQMKEELFTMEEIYRNIQASDFK
ncbi:uncharacterized protein LOC118189701 [Stegodyphus dumicola]|uniref:uncharacterized protein LOC118189701 n=1 Tax=Stegodyphus dumicola TaxID=202533 RepID=UPI0015AE53BC|nr:uncharacterized protein LOC118189701 [Stegodyphus dumicola]